MASELPEDVPDEVKAAAEAPHEVEDVHSAIQHDGEVKQIVIDETPELLKKSLDEFREMIEEDAKMASIGKSQLKPEEDSVARDDKFLLRFLRAKKFEVPRAFKLMVSYENHRDKYGFRDLKMSDPRVQRLAKLKMLLNPTNMLDKEGHKVIFVTCKTLDYNAIEMEDMDATLWYVFDQVSMDEDAQKLGITFIMDMTGYTFWGNFNKAVAFEEQGAKLLQNTIPLRIGHGFVIHAGTMFWALWQVIKFFLKEKVRSRFHVLGDDLKGMYEFCGGLECFPEELGGDLTLTDAEYFITPEQKPAGAGESETAGEGDGEKKDKDDNLEWI